jgi:hypothetical protein
VSNPVELYVPRPLHGRHEQQNTHLQPPKCRPAARLRNERARQPRILPRSSSSSSRFIRGHVAVAGRRRLQVDLLHELLRGVDLLLAGAGQAAEERVRHEEGEPACVRVGVAKFGGEEVDVRGEVIGLYDIF